MSISSALTDLFNRFFIPGRAYPGTRCPINYRWHIKGGPKTEEKEVLDLSAGVLMYQDGTACSASHFLADVLYFKNRKEKPWLVLMDIGGNMGMGTSTDEGTPYEWCAHLGEVFMVLLSGCFHDPNQAGEIFQELGGNLEEYNCPEHKIPALDFGKRYYEHDVELVKKMNALKWTPQHWH